MLTLPPVPLWSRRSAFVHFLVECRYSLVNCKASAHVSSGKAQATHVTALEHELGDDSVEARAGVAEALLARAEGSEVGGSLGHNRVVQLEDDSAGGGACSISTCVDGGRYEDAGSPLMAMSK